MTTGIPIPIATTRRDHRPLLGKFFIATLLLASASLPAPGQTLDSASAGRLQRTIETVREQWNQHGISAAVIIQGRGDWKGVDGESFAGTPVTSDMLFGAGSVTKTFTSALILQLAEEGKLSLADPLHRWLPGHPNIDSTITIRRLLMHTSGIHNFSDNPLWGDSIYNDPSRIWEPEDIVRYFTAEPSFTQGRSWEYCNTGYLLLGMIAERAGGSTLATEFRNRFLTPFELRSTFFAPEEEVHGEMVHPWSDLTGNGQPDDISSLPRQAIISSAWAAGSLISTPADLARWGSALYGGRVLHDSSMARLLTFLSFNGNGPVTGYGLGAFRHTVNGKTVYGHGGNIFGYSTSMLHFPDQGITTVVMVNGDIKADEIGYVLMAEAMGMQASGVAHGGGSGNGTGMLALGNVTADRAGSAVTVEYSLGRRETVGVALYDMLGREIAAAPEMEREAGSWSATIRAAGLPSGLYICRVSAGETVVTKKILL